MKVWLLANDPRLAEELGKNNQFDAVLTAERHAIEPDEADVIVVSDLLMETHELIELRSIHEQAKMVYMISNRTDYHELKRVQSLCAAHRIDFVAPRLTVEQVALEIAAVCVGKAQGASRVITGIGALPQIGLTTSLLMLGVHLGALTGVRIGILGLNGWNPGDSGILYEGKYVDEIWGTLQGKHLRPDELVRQMCRISPHVHYLAGNRDIKKLYYYQPDGASWLIRAARQSFDIVLIDAGAYLDHALAAQSIYESDLLLIELNQSRQAGEQWLRLRDQILRPVFHYAEEKSMLLFNKMYDGPDVENAKQLSRQLGLPHISSLPYVPAFYRYDADCKLLEMADDGYHTELMKACRALMQYYGLPLKQPVKSLESKSETASWFRLPRWLRMEGGSIAK
jgi:hypothetical protein